jgi:16S rRNA (guanine1207-N2)-methyltransferase
MAAVHNDAGSKRCEQYLREVAGKIDSLSKHHSRAFWATKHEGKPWKADLLERWRQGAAMRRILDGRFWSRPGLFNWDRIDEGSALLAKHLPETIEGNVADFGCGWGFLSDHLLRTCHDIDTLDIYDADGDCFECARRNLGLVPTKVKAHPHWQDITTGFERTKFDTVVMNPPFHEGKEADPLIGLKFIAAAAQALRPDGQLWLVANRQLPYENLLTEAFTQMDKIVETGGFKVLHAQKPIVQPTYVRRGKRRR